MSEEEPTLIVASEQDMQDAYERLMAQVPYDTPGQLRDAVFDGGMQCHQMCYNHAHPHGRVWRGMTNWLFMSGKDWREVE